MYTIYGFSTQNTLKVLYVLEELKADYDFVYVDLYRAEHREEKFKKLLPAGKVPVLQQGDRMLFESGAICRYVAHQAASPLYPQDPWARAQVDQWMDFFTCHLGRWLSTLFFEYAVKSKVDIGPRDEALCAEALRYIPQQMAKVESCLAEQDYLAGEALTIADLFALAYVEQVKYFDFSWQDFPHARAWFDRLNSRDGIQRAREIATAK